MASFKVNRLPYKQELMDEYVLSNEYLHRQDMEKFAYRNLDLAVYKAAVRLKLNILRKNHYMWVKTEEYQDPELLKSSSYVRERAVRKPTRKSTESERSDSKILLWDAFRKKYPHRSRQEYKAWQAK